MDVRSNRLDALRRRIPLGSEDAVLVSDLDDIRWLTGFTGSNGWLLLTPTDSSVVTDGRYAEQARSQTSLPVIEARTTDEMYSSLARNRIRRLHFQTSSTSVVAFRRLQTVCVEPVDLDLSDLRRTKDAIEVAVMESAARIAETALAEVCPLIEVGTTERDIRDELEYRMRRLGADGPSYDTIVASGPEHSARPHHRPTQRALRAGDLLVIDVGALVDGYHSDMTRTFVVGEASTEVRAMYASVLEAQLAGIATVGPGSASRDVDEACRRVFRREGREAEFVHGTGHGVGLVIHEEPFLGRASTSILRAGDVVTVEPGLYREGAGGVRIEDLLLVTEGGHRLLTSFPKELTCLPSRPTT